MSLWILDFVCLLARLACRPRFGRRRGQAEIEGGHT